MATAHIGTSGFSYSHWQGPFYPETLSQARWLEYYVKCFATVELNVTFYRLPGEAAVQSWQRRAPEGFIYTAKVSRYITHLKRMHNVEEPLARFLARMRGLGEHLGPLLIQLPPDLPHDPARLDAFLALCDPVVRWAVEFRHPSWLQEDVYTVLRAHRAALCLHDLIPEHSREVTADFVYIRFHGAGEKYGGSYPDAQLAMWAQTIHGWLAADRDVYAYSNNDAHAYAVQNARRLQAMLAAS